MTLLHTAEGLSCSCAMALDEYFMDCISQGKYDAVYRVYTWNPAAISIGRYQKSDEFRTYSDEYGIPVVRRITGGNALYHKGDVSFSCILKKGYRGIESRKDFFLYVADFLIKFLDSIYVQAHTELVPHVYKGNKTCLSSVSQYEICDIKGNKRVAVAQKLTRNSMLEQGTLYGICNDESEIFPLYDQFIPQHIRLPFTREALFSRFSTFMEKLTSGQHELVIDNEKMKQLEVKYKDSTWNYKK